MQMWRCVVEISLARVGVVVSGWGVGLNLVV